jgi:small conductance mechanosensitive channel
MVAITFHDLFVQRWLSWDTYVRGSELLLTTTMMVVMAISVSYLLERLISGFCTLARKRHTFNANRLKKIITIESILQSSVRYSIAVVVLFKILLNWGVPPQSLTIGSAILASAIGFGSQGLIQDMINGFTLLFEDQLRIGDYVMIDTRKGEVIEVGLRVVKIRDLDGTVHTIFNRQITVLTNLIPPKNQDRPAI